MTKFMSVGELNAIVPKKVGRDVPFDASYTPTYSEILKYYPISNKGSVEECMLITDGLVFLKEYQQGDFVLDGTVKYVNTEISTIGCDISVPNNVVPTKGGEYNMSCTCVLNEYCNGNLSKRYSNVPIKPNVECDGAVCNAETITFAPNLSTDHIQHNILCKYGFKGKVVKCSSVVLQEENYFNEWETVGYVDSGLYFDKDRVVFTKDGGIDTFKLTLRCREKFVRKDSFGNIVEVRIDDAVETDVTEAARYINPYDKRFVISNGEIVCTPQKPNARAVLCFITALYDGLSAKMEASQEGGDKFRSEYELSVDGGDSSVVEIDNSVEEFDVVVKSVERQYLGDVLVDTHNVYTLGVKTVGERHFVHGYACEDANGECVIRCRVETKNNSENSDRQCSLVVFNNDVKHRPIRINVVQRHSSEVSDDFFVKCLYKDRVYVSHCVGEKIRAIVYKVAKYDDGSCKKTILDPGEYELKLVVDSYGSMVVPSPLEFKDDEFVSELTFVSENMNDYLDFHIEVLDIDGQVVYKGHQETIKCEEVPIREVVKEVRHKEAVVNRRDTINIDDLRQDKVKHFKLERDENGIHISKIKNLQK